MVSFLLVLTGVNFIMVSSRSYNCSFFTRTDPFPRIMVTGGAGFIGSTLVKRLKGMGYPSVKIVDNFWRGKRENLMNPNGSYVVDEHHDICVADLTLAPHSMHLFRHIDWVIHLADAVAGISFVFDNQSWLFREKVCKKKSVFAKKVRSSGQCCELFLHFVFLHGVQFAAPPFAPDSIGLTIC